MTYSIFNTLRDQIFAMDEGTVFTLQDLGMDVPYTSIRRILSDLSQDGYIQRITNGVYRAVNKHSALARTPSATKDILSAIMRDNSWVIYPGTEMARRILGLSYDASLPELYFSSGRSYTYKLEIGGTLRLRYCGGKFMTSPAVTERTALVTIALMDLYAHPITAEELAHLSNTLNKEEKLDLIKALPYIPARLRPVFEIICGTYGPGGR